MKKEFLDALENKSWQGPKPYMHRSVSDKFENILEKIEVFGYRATLVDEKVLGRIAVDAIVRNLNAKDERDLLEVRELLEDIYIYKEVNSDFFETWAENDISRFFPTLFDRVAMAKTIWILRDDPSAKDCLFHNVDGTVTFLSWFRED